MLFTSFRLIISFILLFLTGCSAFYTIPTEPLKIGEKPTVFQCAELYNTLNQVVKKTQTRDAEYAEIVDFPYLRTDRFLASFRDKELSDSALTAWIDRLQILGHESNAIELANLPTNVKSIFPPFETFNYCSHLLRKQDFSQPQNVQKLRESIQVPPEYRTWKRILGAYWLTAWFIKMGATHLHEEILDTYNVHIENLPIKGQLIQYLPTKQSKPLSSEEIKAIIQKSRNNALNIPELSAEDKAHLLANFAPIWQVDTVSDDDKIGSPKWISFQKSADIDTMQPVVYTYLSHTWFQEEILLQLNYVIWFPARPFTSKFDILGGHLDGLTWRITLSREGTPLVYDSIHNCGCYHLFYPTQQLCVSSSDDVLQEPTFVPQIAPEFSQNQRLILRVAHTTHFLDRIFTESIPQSQNQSLSYILQDYQTLTSLPLPNGQKRSLFQANGIVSGTQRGERWILWPMGIPNPGEMRQRGHHATAFFGRRHFDDSHIMQRAFEFCPSEK
jgi:hypothetical protein